MPKKRRDSNMFRKVSACLIIDEKATTTDGGGYTTGSPATRDLNTVEYNPDSVASVDSNQFTLKPGNWFIRALSPVNAMNQNILTIEDITNTATIARSLNSSQQGGENNEVCAYISVSVDTVYEVQHEGNTTVATDAFGQNSGFSSDEVYTILEAVRL